VDQFFACVLGTTAAELKDPALAAGNYTALYTKALLDALEGKRSEVLEAGDAAQYVRVRRLESYLESEVPRRVKTLGLEQKVNQNPDAIITSDTSWLARIALAADESLGPPRSVIRGVDLTAPPVPASPATIAPPPPDLRGVARGLVRSAADGNQVVLGQQLEEARTGGVAGGEQLAATAQRIATPFGPDHFESQCGIKVRGARIIDFAANRATGELLGGAGDMLRINSVDAPAASVLLLFERNVGTVIPALPGFLAALTFEDNELVDVAYEPSVNSPRWGDYQARAGEVRALRAIAASSSQHGRFRLNQEDGIKVAQKMQYAKSIDPTLGIYAAYAYHDLQAIDRIREMSGYLTADVGTTFFDLALLSRMLVNQPIRPDDRVVPFVPLLSQGWMLLKAHRVKLHSSLDGIEATIQDSLWSLFDATGVDKLRRALSTKEVR
jgi:hypothetical protein